MPLRSANVSASRSSAAREAEVVQRRRPQLDREAPHVLERADDELSQVGLGALAPRPSPRRADRLQPEQDRRQRLARLVVQLAREAPALQLLRVDHAAHGVACDALATARPRPPRARRRSRPGAGRRREKRASGPSLSWTATMPIARSRATQRHVQPGANAHPPRLLLVDLGIVEDGVDARALPALEHAARLGAAAAQAVAEQAVSRFTLAVDRGDPQLAVRAGSAISARRAPISSRTRRQTRSSSALEVRLARERRGRPRAAPRAAATTASPPRRGARSRSPPRPGCEQRDELLVLLGEVLAALLLGEIEVAVGDAAEHDRHAEERAHRRMVRREADRTRIARRGRAGAAAPRRGSGRRGSRGRAADRRSAACVSASMPVVTNRSSAVPVSSITPSAA